MKVVGRFVLGIVVGALGRVVALVGCGMVIVEFMVWPLSRRESRVANLVAICTCMAACSVVWME
jgi:hypothetical protein